MIIEDKPLREAWPALAAWRKVGGGPRTCRSLVPWDTVRAMFPNPKTLLACVVFCAASQAAAHDLPISGMRMVADEQFLHVELMLNSGELVFVGELDRNKNGRLEVAEVNEKGDEIAQRIVDCLTLRTGGREIQADVVGI